jgi:hypothetical protein
MVKILNNTTTFDIFITDMGTLIPSLTAYSIPTSDYLKWAESNDIVIYINNGSIVVNNGSANLPIVDALAIIQASIGVNARYVVQIGYSGTAILGTYLQFILGLPSNGNPFIIPEPAILKAWSFSGSGLGTAIYDIQINGITQFQVNLVNSKRSSAYQLNYNLNIGDEISIKCSSGTVLLAVLNPLLNLFIETRS